MVDRSTSLSASEQHVWYRTFLGDDDPSFEDYGGWDRQNYLFQVEEVKELVESSVKAYYGLEEADYVEMFRPVKTDEEIEPPHLDVRYLPGVDDPAWKITYNLTEDDMGPFEQSDLDLREFIYSIRGFSITYFIEHLIPHGNIKNLDCFAYSVNQ